MPSTDTVTASVIIRCPIGAVFAFLSAPEHLAVWDDAIRWARWSADGPLGVGATFALAHARDGRAEPGVGEVVAYEPPSELGWWSAQGSAQVITRITLQAVGTGTQLTLRRHTTDACGVDHNEGAPPAAGLRRLRDVLESWHPNAGTAAPDAELLPPRSS